MKQVSPTGAATKTGTAAKNSLGRVVVIEDQRLVAEFFSMHCRDIGLEVLQSCATFAEGLAAIRQHRPNLVLMDISLPDGNGLDLAKTILKELPRVKILGISSHRDPLDHAAGTTHRSARLRG